MTSVIMVLLVVAGLVASTFAFKLKPRLGLDLRGGLSVTLTAPSNTKAEVLDKTVEVLRHRIDAAGVAEPDISREGASNVFIQIPTNGDQRHILDLIGRTAQLQFRQVLKQITPADPSFASATVTPSDAPNKQVVYLGKGGKTKLALGPAELTGDAVRKAEAVIDTGTSSSGAWTVKIAFSSKATKAWQTFTGKLACVQGDQRQIAIVLDQEVESHPQVATEVKCNEGLANGDTVITGGFSEKEAKDLALVLTTGALPVKLEQSEVRIVSPTLGKDSLRAGLLAGALGLALVLLYVLLYYRTLGLQTWIGLAVFSSTIYGLVVVFGAAIGWNLSLAGIAGLIVSVGIATDSYIVFFERVKEEIHLGQSLKASIDKGFKHAWRTMRTANLVTILAAVILYILAVGSVRGFALALGMATTLDLAITFGLTWPLAALLARNNFFANNRAFGMKRALEGDPSKEGGIARKIYRSEFKIDFIGRRKIWLAISTLAVAVSVVAMFPQIRGLTYGIDFKGGTVFRVARTNGVSPTAVKEALRTVGLTNPEVQILTDRVSGRSQVQVQTEAIKPSQRNEVSDALGKVAGTDASEVNTDAVGKKWGGEITTKALRGLVIFIIAVILYMSWRLEPKMAAAGIVALIHDVAITMGVYALVGFEVTPATVIATLTILGYSLYDTVVVFDKIRENQATPGNARKSFGQIANESTNQVLMRSINTSLTVLLPVGSLLFVGSVLLGADTLKDLALALFVGIAAGTYSSIFVATPLLSIWKEREPRYVSIRQKILKESAMAAATATSSGSVATSAPSVNTGARKVPTSVGPTVRTAQRKKQSRSKRKKGGQR
ncbi:MAG: protein translocase subunit SecF [Actinobacteria bacterium]|nr:protein translocase subunit SecF [Actinomycetota bacterium]